MRDVRCATALLLMMQPCSTLMPHAAMSRRCAGMMRAEPEPSDTRPTSYANKYNWTASARAPLGETTARTRLAALKAAAENDETIIRVKWSDPRTIAGLCVFIPLLGAGVLYLSCL
jgi:hypothetical protein